MGDHDVKPTPTGKIVVDFLNGDMPAFIDTGLNVVDVRDTAEGHLLACERGRPGERYILGSENLTLAQILQKLAAITGRKAPGDPAAVRGRLLRRRCSTAGPKSPVSRRVAPLEARPHGQKEDVGDPRKGAPRTGIRTGTRGGGAAPRGRVVRAGRAHAA